MESARVINREVFDGHRVAAVDQERLDIAVQHKLGAASIDFEIVKPRQWKRDPFQSLVVVAGEYVTFLRAIGPEIVTSGSEYQFVSLFAEALLQCSAHAGS